MITFEQYIKNRHPELQEDWKTGLAMLSMLGGGLGLGAAGKTVYDQRAKKNAPEAIVAKAETPEKPTTAIAVKPTTAKPAAVVKAAEPEVKPVVVVNKVAEPEPKAVVRNEDPEVVYGHGKLPYEKPVHWTAEMGELYQKMGKDLMRRGAEGVRLQQFYADNEPTARQEAFRRAAADLGSHELKKYGVTKLHAAEFGNGHTVYTVIYSSTPLPD
jgi:hypothetical protein